jgi:hypothetical protein
MQSNPVAGQYQTVHVKHTEIINAPIEALWQLVGDFNNVSQWHPDVVDSRIELGSGKDAHPIRAIHLRDGTPLKEKLLAISNTDHSYTYSVIESPLPLRNHRSTVRFDRLSGTQTRVTWTADFEAVGVAADQIAEGVNSSVMETGIAGLRASVACAARR